MDTTYDDKTTVYKIDQGYFGIQKIDLLKRKYFILYEDKHEAIFVKKNNIPAIPAKDQSKIDL
jgi:hypothetical protein